MTYGEAIDYLYSLRLFGAKFGLSNTLKLAEMAGNPQEKLRFIHVAGTNGKGSTCAILESIYRVVGLRVGLFTSPHLVAFGERIQVNRLNIGEEEIIRQVTEMRPWLAQFPADRHPTFFEVVTVMALRHFAERECELVIWETGLGGRLDATNIVTPLASVITNIQYDHQKWLGSTLASIAAEKAGIIKPGVPVITAVDEREALEVIEQTARANAAPLTLVARDDTRKPPLNAIRFPLLGEHQRLNAALALATIRAVTSIPISHDCVRRGLSEVSWAGRMQLIVRPSGQEILLDGAHNVAGVRALGEGLKKYFPGRKTTLVLGVLGDKDWQQICHELAPLAHRIMVVPVDSDRSAPVRELARDCAAANPSAQVLEVAGIREALEACSSDPFVVVSGSLYLVGEALEALDVSSSRKGERGLNEWQTTGTENKHS
jgi:dihydrofolate synthase/folylpolyglutamate synthase